ncbi:ATP-binding cassette domain-containing protein [Siminovitchia fortis]|uniref:ABC transporter ATP-binding protein n=1 Tax=Siminovitchia fortis TaxID=254758 RepID=A0A443J454_9BACI|nr:ATP-binding cassette domain-containing protein [Siminovitchia fortis]RWR15254.1 ABC transporter ATP-binding protein [Siminovitchia fortis]WHY82597.1 ATP-binding cassette domain-containing protein [Siminovitchia fortis]
MENMIVVKDFVKKYGDYTAVDHVSFEVERGSIFAFLGPNGAGKSTTINTLCTIFEKTSGTLLVDGKDVSTQKDDVRHLIGVVFQESTLDQKMTVEENLRMHCHFYGLPRSVIAERIHFVLEIVDLMDWKKAMASSLSGGMKRRVEIARSLLHFPKVLFLDEPTTGLDPKTRAKIWEYITKLQKEKKITVFLTTHYMDEAEICNKVAVMDHGKIIAIDSPYALKRRYTKDKAHIKSADAPSLETLLKRHRLTFKREEDHFFIEFDELENFLKTLTEHQPYITDLEIKKGTLNDVFLEITGRDIRGD